MTTDSGTAEGVLELHPRGYGFLRSPQRSYAAGQDDVHVPEPLIRKLALREGVRLAGLLPPRLSAVKSKSKASTRIAIIAMLTRLSIRGAATATWALTLSLRPGCPAHHEPQASL